mgnify:FL=1
MNYTNQLLNFIEKCPSPYHRAETLSKILDENGFTRIYEQDNRALLPGGKYYVLRNYSSVIAFKIPKDVKAFNIIAAHLDSPTFKIKKNPQLKQGPYISLNTERYGGMIYSTWFDRPLSVAGRIMVKEGNGVKQKLVNIDRDLLIIPNLAIHMDRTANDGKKMNPQTDLLPLYALESETVDFYSQIAQAAGVEKDDILSDDLFLYNRQKGTVLGADSEFVASPKLDDLQCVFAALQGFLSAKEEKSLPVLAIFDNEEVGSETKQGARSTFLSDVLYRITKSVGGDRDDMTRFLSNSFMISADNAHAVHPNNISVADPTNRPAINGGIVIKYNANQRYTTDGVSAALFKMILEKAAVKYQTFHNRSDILGGGTLGNISNTRVSVNTVDIGLPQLAMHSAYETAGVKDTEDFILASNTFYECEIEKQGDGMYIIK